MLFSGTLRDNLDPFEAYSDDEVWDALEQASLASTVRWTTVYEYVMTWTFLR